MTVHAVTGITYAIEKHSRCVRFMSLRQASKPEGQSWRRPVRAAELRTERTGRQLVQKIANFLFRLCAPEGRLKAFAA